VFEQGEPSERVLVVDLTFNDEDNAFSDTSQDEEFTRRLFGDLNNGHLGLPSDGKVIILNDSDEEEEVREETATNTEAAPLLLSGPRLQLPPPPTLMKIPKGCKMIIVMVLPPIRK
jgi:hypothetical protein